VDLLERLIAAAIGTVPDWLTHGPPPLAALLRLETWMTRPDLGMFGRG
jgi:hypothetical protein